MSKYITLLIFIVLICMFLTNTNTFSQKISKENITKLVDYIEHDLLLVYKNEFPEKSQTNTYNIYDLVTKCKIGKYRVVKSNYTYDNIIYSNIKIRFSTVLYNNGESKCINPFRQYSFLCIGDSIAFEFYGINKIEEYNIILSKSINNKEAVQLIENIYKLFDFPTILKIETSSDYNTMKFFNTSHSSFILHFRDGKIWKVETLQ